MLIANATIVTGGSSLRLLPNHAIYISRDLPWHVIFGFESSMITTTVVAGKVLMENRRLTTLDEVQIAARARELSSRVWKRYEENART
jgi:hypothetical protein